MTKRKFDSRADQQRAYRERQKLFGADAGKPWEGLSGEPREQAIRDFFGYSPSEKRSQAERELAANRILDSEPNREMRRRAEKIRRKHGTAQELTAAVKQSALAEIQQRFGLVVPDNSPEARQARADDYQRRMGS